MEKEFVPYEVVKELSGIGFNEPCFAYYNRDKEIVMTNIRENYNKIPILSAPSFFEAYHWIRKNYPMYDGYYCYNNKENSLWAFNPQNLSVYYTLEHAQLECLRLIMKMIKSLPKENNT